ESPQTDAMGESLLLGARVWSYGQRFRIVIGPVAIDQYKRLLLGGRSVRRLHALVSNFVGDTCAWDVRLILKKEDAQPMQLGCHGRLGWTCQLLNHAPAADVDDLILNPEPLPAGPTDQQVRNHE